MKTNVNMSKNQFGIYDIALGEWLDRHEFRKVISDFGRVDLLNSVWDNIIIPTEHVQRDVVEMLMDEAYQEGLRDCKHYGEEECENHVLFNVSEWLNEKMNCGFIDVSDIDALQAELVKVVRGQYDQAPTTAAEREKHALINALRATRFNRRKAAEMLGLSERTVYRKIREYQIEELS